MSCNEISTVALEGKKGKKSPEPEEIQLRFSIGKQKYKTEMKPFNPNSVEWNEFAFFDIGECDDSLLEVAIEFEETGIRKKVKTLGSVSISILDLEHDRVNDSYIDLDLSAVKISKHNNVDKQESVAVLHLRLYLTELKEEQNNYIREEEQDIFNYDEHKDHLQTGDLILFGEVGFLSVITQLLGNVPYSRVGMVVRLPNQYTEKEKLYIFELTRNFDKFQNAFTEDVEIGINLFRMRERIHEFPGRGIWWLPLSEPLLDDPLSNMVEWIWSIHEKGLPELQHIMSTPPQNVLDYLEVFGLNIKRRTELWELQSTELIIKALTYGGRRLPMDEEKLIVPGDLVDTYKDCFLEPIVLRKEK
eukprot:TRINITY_DN2937_c0_g1_i4.p1 TRINITY_DN2937_c0_g1~~TRINITY_DN2937_c0_g1_i4.p1  ORF type:complete len:360 (-),score=88.75 TRINITY_DN2937_c0_g1_i4:20-1099(-)